MKISRFAIIGLALLMGGCASYGYHGSYGGGDYYYGHSSGYYDGYYGAPYGSLGYGYPGGWYGGVGYGYSRGWYAPYGYRSTYYYPGYFPYYSRPIIVNPRPSRPGSNQPGHSTRPSGAPWRNLEGVRRIENRERPERVGGPRPAGPQPAAVGRQPQRVGSGTPWRGATPPAVRAPVHQQPVRAGGAAPRLAPAARSAPVRQAPARASAPARSTVRDRGRTIEP